MAYYRSGTNTPVTIDLSLPESRVLIVVTGTKGFSS